MNEPLGYYLFDRTTNLWLNEDKTGWISDFGDACEFVEFDLADQHLKYWESARPDAMLYVLAVMPSR